MKYLVAVVGVLIAVSCSRIDYSEDYQYQTPKYFLTFHSNANVVWEVNGQVGNSDTLEVTQFDELDVTLLLDKEANASCVLYKDEYPVAYHVVTCYPNSSYRFKMVVRE